MENNSVSLFFRNLPMISMMVVANLLWAETFYPDVYPEAVVDDSEAHELFLTTSTVNSMDGVFVLTLEGSWPAEWPIHERLCSEGVCNEHLIGLEVSADGGDTWNIIPHSMKASFWDVNRQHTFSGVPDGRYQYRAVTHYYSADSEATYDELYYSPVRLKVRVSALVDSDGDGVLNGKDAFPLNSREAVDTDGDGIGNVTDTDDDGDNVSDTQDMYPLDPTRNGDLDGDGIDNHVDIDANNDGSVDTIEFSLLRSEDSHFGFLISAADISDFTGHSVSGAGDVNGDGFDDVIIGAYQAETPNGAESGAAHVVFGRPEREHIDLSKLRSERSSGFVIYAANDFDHAGYSVSSAGDVNGDGLGDVILGAPQADPNGSRSGASYVVFGKANNKPVDLQRLKTGGFVINGASSSDQSGFSVSGAGDVNGDGLDDVIVGAYFSDPNGFSSGSSYVVFGKADNAAVELSQLGSGNEDGFVIHGAEAADWAGRAVSGAGDMNGDGLEDVIIGAPQADPNGSSSGASYVVFGQKNGGVVELSQLETGGAGGFVINGARSSDQSGISVSAAGDVNGDGLADVIVGAAGTDNAGFVSGSGYVVFGRVADVNTAFELSQLHPKGEDDGALSLDEILKVGEAAEVDANSESSNDGGFLIDGTRRQREFDEIDRTLDSSDNIGLSVSGAGDVNGDGLDDMVVGTHQVDTDGLYSAASYVVFGKADAEAVKLFDMELFGLGGFSIKGAAARNKQDVSVSTAGDLNGDGLADVVIGISDADPNGSGEGCSYVVYGQSVFELQGGEEVLAPSAGLELGGSN